PAADRGSGPRRRRNFLGQPSEAAMSDGQNPMRAAQRLARPELPKRFYKRAAAEPHEGGFAVMLDGRLARTPAKHPLRVDRIAVAEALAAEWDAPTAEIDPAAMPLTRIVNAAIDRVTAEMA